MDNRTRMDEGVLEKEHLGALALLDMQLERLEATVDSLEKGLSSIVRVVTYDSVQNDNAPRSDAYSTKPDSEIRGKVERLSVQTNRLEGLVARIDL